MLEVDFARARYRISMYDIQQGIEPDRLYVECIRSFGMPGKSFSVYPYIGDSWSYLNNAILDADGIYRVELRDRYGKVIESRKGFVGNPLSLDVITDEYKKCRRIAIYSRIPFNLLGENIDDFDIYLKYAGGMTVPVPEFVQGQDGRFHSEFLVMRNDRRISLAMNPILKNCVRQALVDSQSRTIYNNEIIIY